MLSLSLSLSFLTLCFVVLCCTLTRTVCQHRLHIATRSDNNNNAEEISFYSLQEEEKNQGCQLKTTNWCVYPRLFPTPFLPLFLFVPPLSPTLPTPPSSSKTTCTFFFIYIPSPVLQSQFFRDRERDARRVREREREEGVICMRREGEEEERRRERAKNSEEGGDQEGGSLSVA